MKMRSVLLHAMLLSAGLTQADTVIKEVPDTLPGKSFGGLSGFMAGAAAGGPVGAAIGAGLGWLAGGETQKATGLSGKAYRVAREDGSEITIRSHARTWSAGDRVRIVGGRLVAAGEADTAVPPVSALTN
jgi:outer membrane lipoprotein SlyB